jgi:hypothetical protein
MNNEKVGTTTPEKVSNHTTRDLNDVKGMQLENVNSIE